MKIYVVSKNEANTYHTVQSAINAVNNEKNGDETLIYIKSGVYSEKIIVRKSNITLMGESRDSVILSNSQAVGKNHTSTYETATVTIVGDDVKLFNLTIENCDYPNEKSKQAVAAYCLGDKMVFINCRFDSYQDTLFLGPTPNYINSNSKNTCIPIYNNEESLFRYYFYQCIIEGSFDYIFGTGVGYFEKCRLITKLNDTRFSKHIIVCNQKYDNKNFGFVFQNCDITYRGEPKKSAYLAWPWRAATSVVWVNCFMEDYFNKDRWHSKTDFDKNNLNFVEICSFGEGSVSSCTNDLYKILPVEYMLDYDKDIILSGWLPETTIPYINESALLTAISPAKPKLVISVDVEALTERAESDHVNRLIYGNIDGGIWGIGKMMDIADKHDVKITFFLDFAAVEVYGDEIINTGKYIVSRGHDLQLHFHPSMFPASFWKGIDSKHYFEQDYLDYRIAEICVSYILEQYSKCTDQKPVAYRCGDYGLCPSMLKELHKNGVIINSSYHSTYPVEREPRGCFVWSNGMFEVPITVEKMDVSAEIKREFNFNMIYFLPVSNTLGDFANVADSVKKFLKKYYYDYNYNSIATVVMHSWSFCMRHGNKYFDIPNPMYVEYFDYLLGELVKDVEIVTMKDVANTIELDKEYLKSYPIFPIDVIRGCNLCNAPKAAIEIFNKSTVPRRCRICGSLERQRTLVSAERKHPYDLTRKKWLHVSPSASEQKILWKWLARRVITIDILPEVKANITGDISNMPQISDESYDAILMTNVLHHVFDDNAAIKELHRVLRPNGIILMEVNMSGKDETILVEDPTIWYGQEILDKYKVGTFRIYGVVDLANQLAPYFTVESIKEIDIPSGLTSTWHFCIKK